MAENSNKQIVDGLIDSPAGSDETSSKISQALLDQIKDNYALQEGNTTGKIKPNSVFDKVQEQADIDGETETDSQILQKFSDLLKANGHAKDLWNESIKAAINYFVDHFLSEDAIIPVDPDTGLGGAAGGFAIKDIKQADAGLSFEGTPWVKPNYNIDNETYDEVRGNDKIEPVLNNFKQLQFTHSQLDQKTGEKVIDDGVLNKYLRLLMPKYVRRVEVEDLNRNFWVLGQTISAISAFLFDDDSPIANMFKRVISEINQLWENVLYLWVSQNKPITRVHSEVVYLSNNSSMTDKSFDNFDVSPSFENITRRLNYLVDSYPDCNLCICPIIRRENYFKNYYKNEQFSGVWFYDRNKSEWTICYPVGNPSSGGNSSHYGRYVIDDTDTNVSHYEARVYYIDNSNNNLDKVGCIYTDESEYKYYYCFPFSELRSYKELVPKRYYAGIRTNVYFTEAEYGFNAQGKEFFSFNLQIDLDDYTSVIKGVENHYKESHGWSHNSLNNVTSSGMHYIPVSYEPSGTLPEQTEGIEQINISKGFYLGEIPSNTLKSEENKVGLSIRVINARPIKNRLLDFFSSTLSDTPMQSLQSNANQIIQQLSGNEKIATLRVGCYRVDGSLRDAGDGSPGDFWAKDGASTYSFHEFTENKFGNNNEYYQIFDATTSGVNLVDFANNSYPAVAFRGSLYIGAQLVLPDFGSRVKVNYPAYVSWQSVTPIVNGSGIDTESDELGPGKYHVVVGLNQEAKTDSGAYGRIYQNYHIYEFFAKDPEREYGPTNWVIRYSQISVLFGPEATENYEQSFWGTTSFDYSKFNEKFYYYDYNDNEPKRRTWPGLVARVAIHYFSVNENNQAEYFRKEYNRLYQTGTKLAWRNSSSWSTYGNSSLEVVDGYTPKIRKASFDYYNPAKFNFIDNPINGYSH